MIIIEGNKGKYWVGILASIFLGMTFIVAAIGKLMEGTTAFDLFAFPEFVPPVIAEAIYISLPYIELLVGIPLILGIAVKFVASLSSLLIIGYTVSNILLIRLGIEDCASCFGVAGSLAPTTSLYFDGVLAILVIDTLLFYRGKFLNKRPWYWG